MKIDVYVVLEHARGKKDAVVHGVYGDRESANVKSARVKTKGHVSVLKQRVKALYNMRITPLTLIEELKKAVVHYVE